MMDIVNLKTTLYSGSTIPDAVKIVIDAHMYVNGWDLKPTLHTMNLKQDPRDQIAIGWIDDKPVGVALITDCYYRGKNWMMAFVKPEFRYKNIGITLVRTLDSSRPFQYGAGIQGSYLFWDKVKQQVVSS